MAIKIDKNLFYIQSKGLSLILEEREGYLLLKHLGKRIDTYHFSNQIIEREHTFAPNPNPENRGFSLDIQRQIFGQHGWGDFREPSIRIQHGTNDLTDFRFKEAQLLAGGLGPQGLPHPYPNQEAESLALILEDSLAQLRLTLYFTSYEKEATISAFAKLENLGSERVVLERFLSLCLDFPRADYDVISFQGAYGREKSLGRQELSQGIFTVSSNRGASGHSQTPSLILCERETNEVSGQAWAFQLMYSGNFQAFVQQNQVEEVRLGLGINEQEFSWELEPGQDFQTPLALITYSSQGLTQLSQASQTFIQGQILPRNFAFKPRPILLNNWEATYFNFSRKKLLDLLDEASQLGIELFVLDDGWFGQRNDDSSSLGDWSVNEEKLGGSLESFIQEVHAKGLKFGLWIEPEMVSEDSQLYRAHPDWAIQAPGRKHTYSRNQLILNLANPEVLAHLKQVLDHLLSRYEIDYIKWDMNRNMTNVGNGSSYLETRMQSHRYMLALYDLLAYVTEKHDQVLFEACSGGGGRYDLGILRYFPQVWASDNSDAISRLAIQYGSAYLYPPITMGAHVSAIPNHQMGRLTPLATRSHVAMMGNLGYELDLTNLSSSEKEQLASDLAFYKKIRPLVQLGRPYRLINPSKNSNELALQFNYRDQVLVTYVRIQGEIELMERTLRLKGLAEEGLYQVQEQDKCYSGAELMYAGLTMFLAEGDYLSRQLHLIRIA
ncbi:alpha-galactosidase [Streptococcus oricebi]|uniref:Alpha-galactosidase n=1 Tax=Streptococcus oricebi TaxID=1547447 RepID=A0ABS5B0Q2_9STRE|nr:alpha-galactosidase [Streptococcus oricebi]MBP2622411.1 alpha-galactosidase [Streptococcus oricebi]